MNEIYPGSQPLGLELLSRPCDETKEVKDICKGIRSLECLSISIWDEKNEKASENNNTHSLPIKTCTTKRDKVIQEDRRVKKKPI